MVEKEKSVNFPQNMAIIWNSGLLDPAWTVPTSASPEQCVGGAGGPGKVIWVSFLRTLSVVYVLLHSAYKILHFQMSKQFNLPSRDGLWKLPLPPK